MSSIDPTEVRARAAFQEVIVALAEASDARKESGRERAPFPLGPDRAAATYFSRPEHRDATHAAVALEALCSPDAFVDALDAFWREHGHEELCALSPYLRQIARELAERAAREQDTSDLSPFVYAMF